MGSRGKWVLLTCLLAAGCGSQQSAEKTSPMTKQDWGKGPEGQTVELYTLRNAKGMQATITNYGARVTSLSTPDRNGNMADVVLGFDSIDGYLKENPYFGAVVGRYGNRIAKGHFALNGKEYQLPLNNGPNSLHGGLKGFDKRVWSARDVSMDGEPALELTYVSKDREEGYPGKLTAKVTYTLTNKNELRLDYQATTDQDTILNITNHSYFNLAGQGEGNILDHVIRINADKFTPVDETLIPTGELKPVAGTPFDFRQPAAIGARIGEKDEQLIRGKGYDHNFVLNGAQGELALAVKVTEPKSGRVMEVLTTEPGVQFYTGNFLDGTLTGKGGKKYDFRYGFCLETQHFPDSPNQPQFPPVVLKPDTTYRSTTVYRFSAEK